MNERNSIEGGKTKWHYNERRESIERYESNEGGLEVALSTVTISVM